MLRALLYLRLTSFKNWFTSRVRRLRQPKYLAGAIVGGAYFYFFFFRSLTPPAGATRAAAAQTLAAGATLPSDWLPVTTAFGALAMLVFMALLWIVPTQRAALGFTEAEIAFLFPAPTTRRALVHFRLLSAQFRSLIGASIMMLFSNRWAIVGGNPLTHAIGWWFIFSALNLHFSGASFTLTRLSDLGLGVWRRRVLIVAALLALFATTVTRLPEAARWPAMGTGMDVRPFTVWIVALADTAPLRWVLWPLELVMAPFLALDATDFLLALLPALAVVTLHYLWVVRTAVAFEDASIEYAQKRSARLAAWRTGEQTAGTHARSRPAPFHLASAGRPELAFLWKNLLSAWPYFRLRTFAVCAAVLALIALWAQTAPAAGNLAAAAGGLVLMLAAYVLIVGPQFARQDIRSDLAHGDILKTYPLAGWQIIAGELLTPISILTGILWLALLFAAMTFDPARAGLTWLTTDLRVALALTLAVLTPALVTLQLLVPNAAALLFPGWFQTSRTRGGGPEIIGQRMIFFFAQLITMVLALVPAAGMAALVFAALHSWLGSLAALAAAAVLMLAVLGAEIMCGVWLLGARFEKLDLSVELRS